MKIIREKKARFVAFCVSVVLCVIAVLFVARRGFSPLAMLGVAAVVCIPSVWHLFLMPVYLSAKHYCLIAGQYLTFWGAPFVVYASAFHRSSIPEFAGYIYLGAVLLLWGLGAFLKE